MTIRTTKGLKELLVWSADGRSGRIVGNPHTHPGRFSVLWDDNDASHPTSLSELSEVSEAAELWLAGLFAGQGPHPLEIVPYAADSLTAEMLAEWKAVRDEFQATGTMPALWMSRREAFENL